MSESIGILYPTQMPALSDNADIQEALRLYHYGAPSGTGSGQYDPDNTDPLNLVTNSMASFLKSLQDQINSINAHPSVPQTAYNNKGVILVGLLGGGYDRQSVGADGYVLTANSGATNGLSWALPSVTPTNSITMTNKTLSSPVITLGFSPQSGTTYTFALSDAYKQVENSSPNPTVWTVPKNSTVPFPVGTQISLLQTESGQLSIAPEDGTVVINSPMGLKLRTRWSGAVLTKRATNVWVLNGDTSV